MNELLGVLEKISDTLKEICRKIDDLQQKKQPKGTSVQSHGHKVPVTTKLKKRATLAMTLKRLQKKQK